jgi:hypothetical protein
MFGKDIPVLPRAASLAENRSPRDEALATLDQCMLVRATVRGGLTTRSLMTSTLAASD